MKQSRNWMRRIRLLQWNLRVMRKLMFLRERGIASKHMSRTGKTENLSWLDIDFSRHLHIQYAVHRALHHSNLIILSQIVGGRLLAAVWLFLAV